MVFVAVSDETDALPTGTARAYWDPVALRRQDEQIELAEALYRERVVAACHKVVSRLKNAQF